MMGLRKELACLAIMFLILLLLETSSFPDRSARYGSFKTTGSTSQLTGPVQSHGGGLRGDKDEEGRDATFGDEKRKIYTGPNPLHNSSTEPTDVWYGSRPCPWRLQTSVPASSSFAKLNMSRMLDPCHDLHSRGLFLAW
ncbi:unnamed protein product [Dovyalis caffra]|uniref:Uncharacterized protein n=1 Tax=Dovyalis caffra TaxID=77055 RepID=A0AAV1RCS4_9ROSI|nr:unnamed protein product [Dovyalis caffra]